MPSAATSMAQTRRVPTDTWRPEGRPGPAERGAAVPSASLVMAVRGP
jgi:hypothetical protein